MTHFAKGRPLSSGRLNPFQGVAESASTDRLTRLQQAPSPWGRVGGGPGYPPGPALRGGVL